MDFSDLLVTGATWTLTLGGVWAALVVAAATVEVLSDGRLALTRGLGCPPPVRRALLAGLGVVLASGGVSAVPVSAAPAPWSPGTGGGSAGLPVPARPTGGPPHLPRQRVVVHPGDSLWQLSRDRAPRASDQQIADLVARTHRANRQVIGPDPDLIHPGQRLRLPRQRQNPPTSETR